MTCTPSIIAGVHTRPVQDALDESAVARIPSWQRRSTHGPAAGGASCIVWRSNAPTARQGAGPATTEQGERADCSLQLRERRPAFDAEASDPSRRSPVKARIIGSGAEEHEREGVLEIEPAHLSCGEFGVEQALSFDLPAEARES